MSKPGGRVATPIRHQGTLIDVVIKPVGSLLSGTKVRGLIDTGSDFVLISPSIAHTLGLRHVDNDVVGGIGGEEIGAKVYSGCVTVPELNFERALPLYAVDWSPTSHTVLLGRSFLKFFVFRYDGPSELFHFSSPLDSSYHPSDDDG